MCVFFFSLHASVREEAYWLFSFCPHHRCPKSWNATVGVYGGLWTSGSRRLCPPPCWCSSILVFFLSPLSWVSTSLFQLDFSIPPFPEIFPVCSWWNTRLNFRTSFSGQSRSFDLWVTRSQSSESGTSSKCDELFLDPLSPFPESFIKIYSQHFQLFQ